MVLAKELYHLRRKRHGFQRVNRRFSSQEASCYLIVHFREPLPKVCEHALQAVVGRVAGLEPPLVPLGELLLLRPAPRFARLRADPRLCQDRISPFEVDWLWEIEVAMLTATAIATETSLEAAAEEVDGQLCTDHERVRDRLLAERITELIGVEDVLQVRRDAHRR